MLNDHRILILTHMFTLVPRSLSSSKRVRNFIVHDVYPFIDKLFRHAAGSLLSLPLSSHLSLTYVASRKSLAPSCFRMPHSESTPWLPWLSSIRKDHSCLPLERIWPVLLRL
jgi:hypothetical protein